MFIARARSVAHRLDIRQRRVPLVVRSSDNKKGSQYVPSDGFGGISPEKKASNHLRTLFTFVAVRIILAQLQGSGRGALGAYNEQDYRQLSSFLQSEPLRDGDEWVAKLMRINSLLAVRVLEVRLAYCEEDFEYDQLERLARKDMQEANVKLMRTYASTSFKATSTGPSSEPQADSPSGNPDEQDPGAGPISQP